MPTRSTAATTSTTRSTRSGARSAAAPSAPEGPRNRSTASTSTRRTAQKPAASSASSATAVDDVASQLSRTKVSESRTSGSSTVSKPTTKTARATAKGRSNEDAELATQLSKLSIASISTRRAKPAEEVELPITQIVNTLQTISSTLADAVQLGWRISHTVKGFTVKDLQSNALSANRNLSLLRGRPGVSALSVENFALQIVGRLISLELSADAQSILIHAHGGIQRLYNESSHPSESLSNPSPKNLLACTLPPPADQVNPAILPAVGLFHSHILRLLLPSADDAAIETYLSQPSLLDWSTLLLANLPTNQSSALFTSVFQIIAKNKPPNASPSALFNLRGWALRCLVQSSTVQPDRFWEQTGNYVTSIIKANGPQAQRQVVDLLSTLVEDIKSKSDKDQFLGGKGFIAVCEYRMRLAKAAHDTRDLVTVRELLGQTPLETIELATTTYPSAGDALSEADLALRASRLCAALMQPATLVRSLVQDPELDFSSLHLAMLTISDYSTFSSIPNIPPALVMKVTYELEGLRRGCTNLLRAYDSLSSTAPGSKTPSKPPYLVAVTKLLCAVLEAMQPHTVDIICRAIDSYIILAKCHPSNPSHSSYLDKAYNLISELPQIMGKDETPLMVINAWRVVSQELWKEAMRAHRDGMHAATIPNIKRTCELGSSLMDSLDNQQTAIASGLSRDALAEQLLGRWSMLGFSYRKIGDTQLAREACSQAILAARPLFPLVVLVSSTTPVSQLFSTTPMLNNLGSVVDRLTIITTHDLLRPEETSLARLLSLDNADNDVTLVGTLLERQYLTLALGPGSKSKEARIAIQCLLRDTLTMYQSALYPIRRAITLIRQLEETYHDDDAELMKTSLAEVNSLLTRQSFENDQKLAHLVPEYLASAAIWNALIAYRTSPLEHQASAVMDYTTEALAVIRARLVPVTLTPSPRDVEVKPAPNKRSKSKSSRSKSTAPTTPSKARARAPPKAPRKGVKIEYQAPESPTPAESSLRSSPRLGAHNFDHVYKHLDILGHLLGLLGLALARIDLLNVYRVLHLTQTNTKATDGYVTATVELARQYALLGRMDRAADMYAEALKIVETNESSIPPEIQLRLYLRYAETTIVSGNTEEALAAYAQAKSISDQQPSSFSNKALERLVSIERAALAAQVFASIQQYRGDHVSALNELQRSFRLWTRAADLLAKLNGHPTQQSAKVNNEDRGSNPFLVSGDSNNTKPQLQTSSVFDSVQLRVAEGVFMSAFDIAELYRRRGSIVSSEQYNDYARTLAIALGASGMHARALLRLGELKIRSGKLEAGEALLEEADTMLHQSSVPHSIDVYRLHGEHALRLEDQERAHQMYHNASQSLAYLEDLFLNVDSKLQIDSSEDEKTERPDSLIPSLIAAVLSQQIWLLHDMAGDESEYKHLLERFLAIPSSAETKLEESCLMGKLSLKEVYTRLHGDIVLSSLPESTIAVPMGMTGGEIITPPTSTREALLALNTTEQLFWESLQLNAGRDEATRIRNPANSLAVIRAYQTALGHRVKNGATVTAALLDLGSAPTLRGELLEAIERKLAIPPSGDDLYWQSMTAVGSPVRAKFAPRQNALVFTSHDSNPDSDDDEEPSSSPMISYWRETRDRYSSQAYDAVSLTSPQVDLLPSHWMVVSLSITEDQSTLIISRQRPHREPLIFYLPMNRQDRREGEEETEDQFTYQAAMNELNEIISASDGSARNGPRQPGSEGRKAWWSERRELDRRMKQLVENVEYCWLGVFKTALCQLPPMDSARLSAFRKKLEVVLKRNGCIPGGKKDKHRLHLDNALLECFAALSPKCRDEELEDLAYFVLDLFQLHGAQISTSEIDIDQLAIDLRTVLEDYANVPANDTAAAPSNDNHLFLILDKNLQSIPWESIPILRGQSVSRIPSLSFLIDRIHLVRHLGQPLPKRSAAIDRLVVNPRKTFYILNPSGDLAGTQRRFQEWLEAMSKTAGWDGIVGRVPSEQEMINALSNNDLVIYLGHGGAELYVRSQKIRNLPRCASTMLWGCSSGKLRDMGDFDRTGTPYHYMVAGCPSLVANLWDVTDKDIDKLSESVFGKLNLDVAGIRAWEAAKKKRDGEGVVKATSVVSAVATSRDECKLPYLNGAAPVVYGIPFYL